MNNTLKKLPVSLLHLSMWLFIFIFPVLFINNNEPHPPLIENVPGFLLTILLFYINYFLLIQNYLFKRKYLAFCLWNLLITVFFIGCVYYYLQSANLFFPSAEHFPHDGHMFPKGKRMIPFDLFLVKNLLSFSLSIGVAVAIRSTLRLKEEESLREKVENEHLKSEITYLKYQLQPHFFFNTLNNIYALIDVKPELAKEILHKLSKLMRYVLYHAEDSIVPLLSEIDFLKNYIDLMSIRISSNTIVKIDFQEINKDINVPPLLFITLVENAYKHGIDATLPGVIFIKLEYTSEKIKFSVNNTCFHKTADDQTISGIGLENLNKRLQILYRDQDFELIRKQTDKEYHTELVIPVN